MTVGPLTLKQPAPRATMMYYQQQRLLSKPLDLSHLIRSWLSSSPHLRLSRSHRVCVPDQHNRTPGDVRVRHNHHVVKHALGLVRDSSCARSLTHHRAGFVTEVLRIPGPSAADRGAQESSWCYNPRAFERFLHYRLTSWSSNPFRRVVCLDKRRRRGFHEVRHVTVNRTAASLDTRQVSCAKPRGIW